MILGNTRIYKPNYINTTIQIKNPTSISVLINTSSINGKKGDKIINKNNHYPPLIVPIYHAHCAPPDIKNYTSAMLILILKNIN
jgi:hypothetical protein